MKSVLENIKSSIENLSWSSETKKQKAIDLCISIYNLFIYDGGDFYRYKSLSKGYFISIIKSKSYLYEIKDNLINNNILEVNNSYNVNTGKSKGYRFNNKIISGEYVALSSPKVINKDLDVALSSPKNIFVDLNQSNKVSPSFYKFLLQNPDLYHICSPKLETYINKGLQRLTFKPEINDWINNFTLTKNDIKVNNDIDSDYFHIVFDNDTYRYKKDNALKLSSDLGLDLIEYKEKCYIDNIENFLIRKTNDLKLIFRKSIFDINNKIFRISRNETNRRLDYNLTNMKSDLLSYLETDGEPLIELDISNAQFAILSYLIEDIDDNFRKLCAEGNLYNIVNKKKMFRVAFDKIKSDQDDVRELFPSVMAIIDNIKSRFGYKYFSNLLQNAESLIMIDGLMNILIDKGFTIFPLHDAIRVKKSELDLVKKEIDLYFKEIGFNCNIRIKNDKKIIDQDIIKEDDFWEGFSTNKKYYEKGVEDNDFGESDGIEGFIETIDI